MKFLLRISKIFDDINDLAKFRLTKDNIQIEYSFDDRKPSDSFVMANDFYMVLVIGVFFEDEKVEQRNQHYFEKIVNLYKMHGLMFPEYLRGCFCGFLYDLKSKKTVVFTDHTSCRRIFYYEHNKQLLFSSDINMLTSYVSKYLLPIELDIDGSLMLLQNGYMIGDTTLVKNLKKLSPGTIAEWDNYDLNFYVYFDINSISKKEIEYHEAVDQMEKMFSQAIKREFNRDLIDNKSHLVTLSGGLDSRAVRFVAMKLGYNNVTNITMSQSKYLDYSIALEISNSLNDDFIFFSLDSAKYLYKNIAKSCFNNGGTVLYNGNAHLDHMIDNIDTENYGLLHTGMIGDAIVGGSFIREENLDFSKAQYSSIKNFYPYKVNDSNIRYRTQEMNLLYNRGINGAFNGLYSTQRKVEAYSPFIDPDFIKFIYSLPNEYRKKSKIYIDWMKKYHHDMLKFKWEKTSLKPNSNKLLVLFVKIYKALYRRILISNKKSMNPYDYWYKNNEMFKREIDRKTIEALKILEPFPEINEPINELFDSKKTINKLLVISLANSISVLGIVHFSGEENEKN